MKIASVTISLSVSNLIAARDWYEGVFEFGAPDLEPAAGVVEYKVGGVWLQLDQVPPTASSTTIRFEVADVTAQQTRLRERGIEVSDVMHIEGVIDYIEFSDPDGNPLSLYTLL